ncbi:hypothetical protein DPMN_146734 [Dreissena polymorpha]|uniref:Uncharacterized protein n=1 Tax=Dreissena polymorpha TaxID=45954 RepID=A0A9D4F960_DREPO|nr:hypothetical protein DPMN_146734 [Dreissena polymorpha]
MRQGETEYGPSIFHDGTLLSYLTRTREERKAVRGLPVVIGAIFNIISKFGNKD